MIKFVENEYFLAAMFQKGNRQATIEEIHKAISYICKRFDRKLLRSFHGYSISVSDVLVLNKAGVVTSFYVEREGFTVIVGFIRRSSSGALVSLDTADFHIAGKEGSWLA